MNYLKQSIIVVTPVMAAAIVLASCTKNGTDVVQSSTAAITQAQILECVNRPATPLELSQGAHFGLTIRAIVPINVPVAGATPIPIADQIRKGYSFDLGGLITDPDGGGPNRSVIAVTNNREHDFDKATESDKPGYIKIETTSGLRWKNLGVPVKPLPIYVTLIDNSHSYPRAFETVNQNYQLKNSPPPFPDPSKFRKENFKVTRVTLQHNPYSPSYMSMKIYFDDVIDHGNGLMSTPQCIGYWNWGEKKPFYRFAKTYHTEYTESKVPKSVVVMMEIQNLRLPPAKGTKIHGLLSVSNGWPQDISVECPPKLPTKSTDIDLKFTTKLAPLPKVNKSSSSNGKKNVTAIVTKIPQIEIFCGILLFKLGLS
jgi:hypothetical protein